MKKTKIYLDTSIISYLDQNDTPDKMQDTHILWEQIKQGLFDVYLSNVTIEEVGDCKSPEKRNKLIDFLSEITYTKIVVTTEIEELAQEIIKAGILTQKSLDDCLHIASAIVSECNVLLSWNFKHLVNIRTINGVRSITALTGYRSVDIYTPTIFVSKEED